MKEPREWDEGYLLSLPPGEHNWVEMKGRRTVDLTVSGVIESKVRDDLSKAISALANSGGGTLVLGLRELPNGWAVDDGGVALSVKGKMSTREWLEDVIPNLVEEPLVNFNVYVITRGDEGTQIEEGRGVFVVEVGDSEQAPHQASDNKYYARVGGKSRPIGHRLVMDIANRRRHPKMELSAEFEVVRQNKFTSAALLGMKSAPEIEEVLKVHFTATNKGKVLVNFMDCFIWVPKTLVVRGYPYDESLVIEEFDETEYVMWSADNTERDVTGYSRGGIYPSEEYGPSWYRRILPGLTHSWDRQMGSDAKDLLNSYSDEFIRWEIYADNAPVEAGKIRIGDIKTFRTDLTKRPRD